VSQSYLKNKLDDLLVVRSNQFDSNFVVSFDEEGQGIQEGVHIQDDSAMETVHQSPPHEFYAVTKIQSECLHPAGKRLEGVRMINYKDQRLYFWAGQQEGQSQC
jgi:hypothetical protein